MAHLVDLKGLMDGGACYTWYIQGPKEKILVDTGAHMAEMPPQPLRFPDAAGSRSRLLNKDYKR
jgi:hypothetical protein